MDKIELDGPHAAQAARLVDETERRENAERRLDHVLRSSGMAIWECDLASGHATHAVGMDRVFGCGAPAVWSVQDIVGAFVRTDREAITRAFARAEQIGSIEIEGTVVTADGTPRRIRLEARLLPSASTRLFGCARAVTSSHEESRPARTATRRRTPTRTAGAGAQPVESSDTGHSALLCAAQLSHQWLESLQR